MNAQGYAKVRAALDTEGIVCGVSPVPFGDMNPRMITLEFTDDTTKVIALHALHEHGLLDDGSCRQTGEDPSLRVFRITPNKLELEDLNAPVPDS